MSWKSLLRLTELNRIPDFSSAHFSLDYKKASKKYEQDENINIDLLSRLIGDADLIIELNTSLMTMNNNKKETELVETFISEIRNHSIDYNYRKIPYNNSNRGFMSLFTGKTEAHQVFAYIPNKIWQSPSFQQILPEEGLRYYITGNKKDNNLLNEIQRMMDSEKLASFKIIIFDNKILKCMGINSTKVSVNDIRELLGI